MKKRLLSLLCALALTTGLCRACPPGGQRMPCFGGAFRILPSRRFFYDCTDDCLYFSVFHMNLLQNVLSAGIFISLTAPAPSS